MSDKDVSTKHLVIDLKTGFAYGIKLDAEGQCKAAQPLNVSVEALNGSLVKRFGPLVEAGSPVNPVPPSNSLPFGQTSYAVELKEDGTKGQLFTIVWPKKAEAAKGALPVVAVKALPENLMDAGFAARPKLATTAPVDEEAKLKAALRNIDDMIGLDAAKRDIKQNIAVARFNKMKEDMGLATKPISRHMVFTGNPGTGKTTFAREVAKVYHALGFIDKPVVHEVKREDLVAGFIGQTALKTKEAIDKAKGGILFIDEAYALSREAGGGDGKDFGREAIDTLVAAMENMRENLIVIVAGYTDPMKQFIDANPGLKSRFMTYINFDDYDMKDLGKIMDFMLQERGYTMSEEARVKSMQILQDERDRTKKDFGNGRTVRNLVEKAEKELAMRLETENKLSANHGLPDAEIRAALTTITLEDVKNVNLQGLSVKPKTMGFASDAPKNEHEEKPNARHAFAASAKPSVAENDNAPAVQKPAKRRSPAPKH